MLVIERDADGTIRSSRTVPNPGSDEAIAEGCICAVLDNARGRGDGPFWITEGCPLHQPQTKSEATHD